MSLPPQSPVSGDTEPFIRDDETQEIIHDFARLYPDNPQAQIAFDAVATKMLADEHWRPYAQQFMHIDSVRREVSPDPGTSSSELEQELEGGEQPPQLLLTGWYRINLDVLPSNPVEGWHVGSDSLDRQGNEVNEIILTPTGTKDHVRWRHARLAFNFSSYTFLVIAEKRRNVTLNGAEKFENSQRSLGKRINGLSIGNLNYKFVFTGQDKDEARAKLDALRTTFHISGLVPPKSLDPTPSISVYEYMGFVIGEVFAQGSTCTVSYAVNKLTGNTVVAKRMKRTRSTKANIAHEVRVLRHLSRNGHHPRICNLVDELYGSGSLDILGPHNIDEVLLFYSPAADETFNDLIVTPPPFTTKLVFLAQFLEALQYIHSLGVMHCDIKPINMAIVSRSPPRGVLIDFGAASLSPTSTRHFAGTIPYLAPETWKLKDEDPRGAYPPSYYTSPPYTSAIDIWALGLSAYQLFCQKQCTWGDRRHEKLLYAIRPSLRNMCIREHLCPRDVRHDYIPKDSIGELIWAMLEPSAEQRLSASEALAHPCLRHVETEFGDGNEEEDETRTLRGVERGGESLAVPQAPPPPPLTTGTSGSLQFALEI